MRILNMGSLNIDRVYDVEHIAAPSETLMSKNLSFFCGGKGLNQSIALARGGAVVLHLGAVGYDGEELLHMLKSNGIDISLVKICPDMSSGHAVIQVTPSGCNSIIVSIGANRTLTVQDIDKALAGMQPGDFFLTQNEMQNVGYAIKAAKKAGLRVVFNPSPITPQLFEYPLNQVDIFILNEIEGMALADAADTYRSNAHDNTSSGITASDDVAVSSEAAGLPCSFVKSPGALPDMESEEDVIYMQRRLSQKFPHAMFVLTLGKRGAICWNESEIARYGVYDLPVVDTTGAGDTFCGYFLSGCASGLSIPKALQVASAAASLMVSRKGAASSIPLRHEAEELIRTSTAIVAP